MGIEKRRLVLIAAATTLIGSIFLGLATSVARRSKDACNCAPLVKPYTSDSLIGAWQATGISREETLTLNRGGSADISVYGHLTGSGFWSTRGSCLHLKIMMTDAWYKPTYCVTLSADGKRMQLDHPMINATLLHRVAP